MNTSTAIILGIVIVAVVIAIKSVKKSRGCSCGSTSCESCPSKAKRQ